MTSIFFLKKECDRFIPRTVAFALTSIPRYDIIVKKTNNTEEKQMKQTKNLRIIALIYFLVLYALWACLECVIVPKLKSQTLPVSVEIIK